MKISFSERVWHYYSRAGDRSYLLMVCILFALVIQYDLIVNNLNFEKLNFFQIGLSLFILASGFIILELFSSNRLTSTYRIKIFSGHLGRSDFFKQN